MYSPFLWKGCYEGSLFMTVPLSVKKGHASLVQHSVGSRSWSILCSILLEAEVLCFFALGNLLPVFWECGKTDK